MTEEVGVGFAAIIVAAAVGFAFVFADSIEQPD